MESRVVHEKIRHRASRATIAKRKMRLVRPKTRLRTPPEVGATGSIAINQLLQVNQALALQSTKTGVPSDAQPELRRLRTWRTKYEIFYLLQAVFTPVHIEIEDALFSLPACGRGAAERRMEPCEQGRDSR